MTSDNVILVAGGDLRQQYAARRLRQKTGADVWALGLPAQSGLHSAETLEEVPAYDVLVLPVPASPDGTTVPAPFGKAALPLETLAAQINHQSSGASVENIPWSVALRIEELTKSAAENYLGSILGSQEIVYSFELSFINRAEQDSPWQPDSPVIVRLERKIDTNTYKDIKLYAILNGAPEQQALTMDAGSLRITSSGSSSFIVTGTRQEAQKPQEEETKADSGSTPAASAAPQPSAKPAIKAAVSPKPTASPEVTPEVSAQPEPASPSAATPQPSFAPEATQVPEAKQNSSSLGGIGIAILVILAAGGCFFVIKRKQ